MSDDRAEVLHLQGDVDAAAVAKLRDDATTLLDTAAGKLTVDLTSVRSLDSGGLGALVWLRENCLDAGVALTLYGATRRIHRLFSIVGLEQLFEFAGAPPAPEPEPQPAVPVPGSPVDGTPDGTFDRFAVLVRRVLKVPVATVALVDETSHTLPGIAGVTGPFAETREVPISHSFCSKVVRAGAPLVLADARIDPAHAQHPAVLEHGMVAYAGMPLLDLEGRIVGTLCATDSVPRRWSDYEIDTLADIAAACSAELQLRGAIGLAAVSADRERMARHLHEHVTGELLQVSMHVGSARSLTDGRAADLLDESMARIDTVLKNIRETLYSRA